MQHTVQNHIFYFPTEGFRLQPEDDPPGSSLYLLKWHQPILPHRRALFQGVPGATEITQSTCHAYFNTQDQKSTPRLSDGLHEILHLRLDHFIISDFCLPVCRNRYALHWCHLWVPYASEEHEAQAWCHTITSNTSIYEQAQETSINMLSI